MDVNHTVKMIYFQTVMILNNYVKNLLQLTSQLKSHKTHVNV